MSAPGLVAIALLLASIAGNLTTCSRLLADDELPLQSGFVVVAGPEAAAPAVPENAPAAGAQPPDTFEQRFSAAFAAEHFRQQREEKPAWDHATPPPRVVVTYGKRHRHKSR